MALLQKYLTAFYKSLTIFAKKLYHSTKTLWPAQIKIELSCS